MAGELSPSGNPIYEAFFFYSKAELEESRQYEWPDDQRLLKDVESEGPLDWLGAASCVQIGQADYFFPGKGASTSVQKRICSRCHVNENCTSASLDKPTEYGIWGGKSEHDRRGLNKVQKRMLGDEALGDILGDCGD